ncbi:MAG: peptidylprolyl isomerase [Bacteroidales bacterium]|nr:peptidylprolyl isomerase [Bacteroidales bacterium]
MNFEQNNRNQVIIETSKGIIKVKLYDETPSHRDNFIKLAKEGFFDDTIFHRVIKGFMIQTGDPDSKGSDFTKKLGAGGPGYTLPAEIVYPKYFHKKGALAAARQPDRVNPEKKSSGSQFYIVTGSVLTDELMNNLEKLALEMKQEKIFEEIAAKHNARAAELLKNEDHEAFQKLQNGLSDLAREEADKTENFKFTDEMREIYTTIGGSPFLDREYTVFGEVIEGMDVVEEIQNVRIGVGDRPIEDILVKISVITD